MGTRLYNAWRYPDYVDYFGSSDDDESGESPDTRAFRHRFEQSDFFQEMADMAFGSNGEGPVDLNDPDGFEDSGDSEDPDDVPEDEPKELEGHSSPHIEAHQQSKKLKTRSLNSIMAAPPAISPSLTPEARSEVHLQMYLQLQTQVLRNATQIRQLQADLRNLREIQKLTAISQRIDHLLAAVRGGSGKPPAARELFPSSRIFQNSSSHSPHLKWTRTTPDTQKQGFNITSGRRPFWQRQTDQPYDGKYASPPPHRTEGVHQITSKRRSEVDKSYALQSEVGAVELFSNRWQDSQEHANKRTRGTLDYNPRSLSQSQGNGHCFLSDTPPPLQGTNTKNLLGFGQARK